MSEKEIIHKKIGKGKIAIIVLVCVVLMILLAGGIYVNDYYKATPTALSALESDDEITVDRLSDGNYLFMPKEPLAGLIFYPGGKVAHEAYASLMQAYAREGICCILVEMPLKLAVLDMNAAEGIKEQYPEIEKWYIGGHSLGGSMAAGYLEKHWEEYEGLLLLASYSIADLRNKDLEVISLYGSQDKVLNLEKYEEYRTNLPEDMVEEIIAGGCHAYFGSYGAQKGDGTPEISQKEQIEQTIELSIELMKE